MFRVMWKLTWFDKRTEDWQGETRLRGAKISDLRKLFGASSQDPMFDSFPVERAHLSMIRKWVDVPINFNKYDYFVECSALEAGVAVGAGAKS